MRRTFIFSVFLSVGLVLWGCGDEAGVGDGSPDVSSGDGSTMGDASADVSPADGATSDGGGGGDATLDAAACMSAHPNVEGVRRFCDPGACYCADSDACYPTAVADACCPVAVVCEAAGDAGTADGGATDAGMACMGAHPNVEGSRRFCDVGACYCGSAAMMLDVCYAAAEAAACCPVDVVCE